MNIPKPYLDEHVLGWRGRIKFFNHHPNVKHTIQELRLWLNRHHSESGVLAKGMSQLFVLSRASMLTEAEFAQLHTLIPFSRMLGPVVEEATLIELHNIFIKHGLRVGKKGAWYCTSCVKQDWKDHGSSYWRRSHQILGVDWCYKHRHQLRGSEGHEAFDHDPMFAKDKAKPLTPPGPKLLDETEPAIQRYVEISLALLNGRKRFDRAKVSAMIELQFSAQRYIAQSKPGAEVGLALETHASPYWINRFAELRTKTRDSDILDFNRLFVKNIGMQDTERYVVAIALLFNSVDSAMRQLDRFHEIKISLPIVAPEESPNPWLGEHVLDEYVLHGCCHRKFADAHGIEFQSASNALLAHGLPNFNDELDTRKEALNDFFKGKSLGEACKSHGLRLSELEHMLRIASGRLGHALAKIEGTNKTTD